MAKEYIEREALIAEYDRVHIGESGGARKLMVDATAADVVEVVRCKDCKYYKQNPYSQEEDRLCMSWSDWLPTDPEDFCSYGERKTEND